MAVLLPSHTHSFTHLSLNSLPFWSQRSRNPFPNPNPTKPHNNISTALTLSLSRRTRNLCTTFVSFGEAEETEAPNPKLLLRFSVSAVMVFLGFFGFGWARRPQLPLPALAASALQEEIQDQSELRTAFEAWKSKTYALTVPLTIVALRGSLPPSWAKDFIQSQGKRLKLRLKYNANLEGIFSDLCMTSRQGISPSSTLAADVVSVGDSWLNFAINKGIIEPIQGVEDQEWFKGLSDKWKVYLRRNSAGEIDSEGKIWAAPYRWGCMVIAYKKSKFQKHKLAPIEDWADLWRPELEGRISMVDSPREVVGAVLKYMGASYNTNNLDLQVAGGRLAVQKNLQLLERQVRLFDSVNYLKAFGVGDVWVAVGWSTDVIPLAKRSSNVAVIVPKSGASLWADLWAIPAASGIDSKRIGGRVRGASPLIHQWIEFCLQAARTLPFKQEVIPGASPAALESTQIEMPTELTKGKPRLDTNLIAGVPPTEILARCEFLEPLSDSTLSDYRCLISSMQKPGHGFIHRMHDRISMMIQNFWLKRNMH
ncbi:hypothetical protein I3843_11G103900 [Carya illinoinensis]|nr:uncharacterized protein LOC122281145 [Carya illinoinensis]KAG2680535.1 hypothetical protein I3760_11G102700 [Carya illinoinensis]KAG7956022.1 hypothetical protein I3843_11G103900 [Carya illinoinensis]